MTFAKQLIHDLVDPAAGPSAPRVATRNSRRRGPRSRVRRGLKAVVLISAVSAIAIAGTGLISVRAAHDDANQVSVLMSARNHIADIGRGVNDLRINVNRAMLSSRGVGTLRTVDAEANLLVGATSISNELTALQTLSLPASADQPITA